jgi:hypothetical protein
MSVFAPPARRGDFLYSSVLYADPGNANHHPRASVAELAALLRPEAPNVYSKGRKPEASLPVKDPAWHYYSAQLIHYGLPVTKDKNGAKVRLLNAMNQFKLEVPAWVMKLEGELKKEWEAENRKMKKSGGAGGAVPKEQPKSVKGKAKAAQSTKGGDVNVTGEWKLSSALWSTNQVVNLSLSSGLSMIQQLSVQQNQGVAPNNPSPAKRKRADSDPPTKTSKAKQETPAAAVKKAKKEPAPAAKAKKEPTPATKAKKEPAPSTKVKKEPASTAKVKKEPALATKVKKEPASRAKGSQVKQEHTQSSPLHQAQRAQHAPPSRNVIVSGNYEIRCPIAEDVFREYDLDLSLAFDASHDTWWATFRWGAWDGIMKMTPGPTYIGLNQPCTLGWRLRDLETNQLRFGKRCTGVMTIFEDGTLTGHLFEMPDVGTVNFDGRRQLGPSLEDDLQHEWDGFVSEAYGR